MSSDSDAWLMRKFFRKYTAKSIKPLAMLKPFKNDVSYVGLAAFPLFKMIVCTNFCCLKAKLGNREKDMVPRSSVV